MLTAATRPSAFGSGPLAVNGGIAFGLAAGPIAWFVQLVANYALVSIACFPHDFPRTHPLPGLEWVGTGRIVINIVAAVVAMAATLVSLRIWWRIARHDTLPDDTVVPLAADRVRFLAASGVLLGLGSLAAILFNLVPLLTLPLCPR
jgi:hypothetical protein